MYTTIATLVATATAQNAKLWQIVLVDEMTHSGMSEDEIFAALKARYAVMTASATAALTERPQTAGSLISGAAASQAAYAQSGGILGKAINAAMSRALSAAETNAAMGKICACPTAGACGVVPAVLMALAEQYSLTERQTLEALLTASGIGAVITRNATVSGAEAGCQAECGVAAAMAAGAAAELAGGTAEQAANAVSLALINCMGLICDPIAGLVQFPCAARNASQAVNALVSADLALGGMLVPIPVDEVIEAMHRVGKLLPAVLKETALGGIANTPTGKAIAQRVFSNADTQIQ